MEPRKISTRLVTLVTTMTVLFAICDGLSVVNPKRTSTPRPNCGPNSNTWNEACCTAEQKKLNAHLQKYEDKNLVVSDEYYYYDDEEGKCQVNTNDVSVSNFKVNTTQTKCKSLDPFCTWSVQECSCKSDILQESGKFRGRSYELYRQAPDELYDLPRIRTASEEEAEEEEEVDQDQEEEEEQGEAEEEE